MASRRGGWAGAPRVQPEGKIRQSQVVTTFGPGALVDLVEDAVLIGGLDFWRYDAGDRAINEPRLRDALAEHFTAAGRALRVENPFLRPPVGDDKEPRRTSGIQVLEFPRWFVCQNPSCRALVRNDALELRAGHYVHSCDDRKKGQPVPVRFVTACLRGHLDDFPWAPFVHDRAPICAAPILRLLEGSTGDFAEVRVTCACGKERALIHAMATGAGPPCSGHRPWLGREGQEECDEKRRLLVRTASNSYFAQVVSALSIPEGHLALHNAVQSAWTVLQAATKALLPAFRTIPDVARAIGDYSDDEVIEAVEAVRQGKPVRRDPLRTAEFKEFVGAKGEAPGDLPKPGEQFFARSARLDGGQPAGVRRVVLAHKLREVRVQVGFTRIEPATPDLQGEFDLGVETAALGLLTNWLPAIEVLGEGVFIQLDEEAVRAWERRPAVLARGRELLLGYEARVKGASTAPAFPGVRFYLLHSLSHLLISALSLECGYAASAIRERIYCAHPEMLANPTPMAAILLSTGSPGTEGTLGGLVEQGRRLRDHLRYAWNLGTLCSNDPVCAAHSPARELGDRYLEGAACHGCLFTAECSCEWFNRYLDRALVVPTIGHDPEVAFFHEAP